MTKACETIFNAGDLSSFLKLLSVSHSYIRFVSHFNFHNQNRYKSTFVSQKAKYRNLKERKHIMENS